MLSTVNRQLTTALMKTTIFTGDITDAPADAICTSTNPRLSLVMGTGGLSHWVGSEERIEFMNRPAGTRWAEIAQHPVEIDATGPINDEFDRKFLDALGSGAAASFIEEWTPESVEEQAGNGAQEIRNWILAAGMAGDAPAGSPDAKGDDTREYNIAVAC